MGDSTDSSHDTKCVQINHNAAPTVHVTSLYPDILGHIFLLLAERAGWRYQYYVPQTSHVCRYWRTVAIQTPQLWNRFIIWDSHFLERPWTQECIDRSRSALLDITVYPYSGITPKLIPDLCRVQSLKINGSSPRSRWHLIKEMLQSYTGVSNPNMQSLTVSYHVPYPVNSAQLPFLLFHDNTPNLVYLHLNGCSLDDWNCLAHLHFLKVLILAGLDGLPSLEALSHIPYLEDLSINFAKPMTTALAPTTNTIRFPSLRKFFLHNSMASMTSYILACIHLPSCTKMDLECSGGTEQDFVDLAPVLTRFLTTGAPLLSTAPLHCLELGEDWIAATYVDGHKHSPNACTCTSALEVAFTSDGTRIEVSSDSVETKFFVANNIIIPLSLCFNHRHTRYLLWFHNDVNPSEIVFDLDSQLFSQAPELRVLDVVTNQAGFLDAIVQEDLALALALEQLDLYDEKFTSASSKPQPACPNLVTLNIIHPDSVEPGASPLNGTFFNELSSKLMTRKRMLGRPLQTLCIHGFGELTEPERAMLKDVAQDVHFELRDIGMFLGIV